MYLYTKVKCVCMPSDSSNLEASIPWHEINKVMGEWGMKRTTGFHYRFTKENFWGHQPQPIFFGYSLAKLKEFWTIDAQEEHQFRCTTSTNRAPAHFDKLQALNCISRRCIKTAENQIAQVLFCWINPTYSQRLKNYNQKQIIRKLKKGKRKEEEEEEEEEIGSVSQSKVHLNIYW